MKIKYLNVFLPHNPLTLNEGFCQGIGNILFLISHLISVLYICLLLFSAVTPAIRFQQRTDGGFPELGCGIKVLKICFGAFLFDQINPVGQLAISSFQAICPTLIFPSSLLTDLPAWVSKSYHLSLSTGSVSCVSWQPHLCLLAKKECIVWGGLRGVDTFQGLGAQMWPISPTATKPDWGSVSIF